MMKRIPNYLLLFFLSFFGVLSAQNLPAPADFFGHEIGEDYHLVNYTQAEKYFTKLAEVSDRAQLQEIGKTEEGRSMYMLVVSSPENLKNLARYKEISQKLARAEIPQEEANNLAKEGKAVVWIDGGLHATETVGAQQLIQTAYELLNNKDEETLRILDDVIILLCEINPDGQELVSNWYMQEKDPEKRNMNIPRLYHKYVGHDNNRDWYMNSMKETESVSRQLYIEWMPQIVYNHHQTGPAGTVLAGPPYRDPFNYVYDPLVITGIDGVAASMINRLNAEGKPGYTRLGGSVFNTWWNGGMRTVPYFHNMIGLLTEITGNPTPANTSNENNYTLSKIPFVPDRLIADNNDPFPVSPQNWPFKRSIAYSVSLNYAVLDYASRMRDHLLKNIYQMGKNSIERGRKDTWTIVPKDVERVKEVYEKDVKEGKTKKAPASRGVAVLPKEYYDTVLRDPDQRDPRGYIIPASQADFSTAVKFINALIKSGIKIHKATADFTVGNKTYPQGSYIVRADQAFRPHVIDLFEPQNYRNDFQYPGGPPIAPYDSAGWTLALQMGVEFDRILDDFSGPFEALPYGEIQKVTPAAFQKSSHGYLLSVLANDTYKVVNNLLKQGVKVERTLTAVDNMPAGSFFIPASAANQLAKETIAAGTLKPLSSRLADTQKIKKSRIALFDRYGGSMPSGWVRWLMEQYNYDFKLIYPQEIDAGNLNAKYDVILFIDQGIPAYNAKNGGFSWFGEPDKSLIPSEYHSWLGSITPEKSIPELKKFIEKGGNVVTVGKNTQLAYHLGLPVTDALQKTNDKGEQENLSSEEYYVPSSILEVTVDTDNAANWGLPAQLDVVFNNDPVFHLASGAKDIQVLSHFADEKAPLKSGWAWGQDYLKGGITSFTAKIGKGNFYAFSPEITFRAQSHGSFKILFNQLYNY